MTTRSQAYAYYRCCKLDYADIDESAIQYLICLLDEQFAIHRKQYFETRNHILWQHSLSGRAVRVAYNSDGGIRFCHINARCMDGAITEAISFFDNKGISFAKDADDEDVQPVLNAFIDWCDWLSKRKFEDSYRQLRQDEEEEPETTRIISVCILAAPCSVVA